MFDIIIIGAGPAGLTASIYSTRRMMKTLILTKSLGGQLIWTSEIENYPGIKSVLGPKLVMDMYKQAKNFGAEIRTEEVKKIIKQDNGIFKVSTGQATYEAKAVIIAMGLSSKPLNLPNEKELAGKGISYCANCDGPFFKGKIVAVTGGGNAALDAAEVMSKIASQVYLIYRRERFGGFEILVNKVKARKNIKIMLNSEITAVFGQDKLEKIKVINTADKTIQDLEIAGLFVEIGYTPKTDLVDGLIERDSKGQIIVDLSGKTSMEGVFAAGDVTQIEYKQIVVGCGQGAVAALSAYKYLQGKK